MKKLLFILLCYSLSGVAQDNQVLNLQKDILNNLKECGVSLIKVAPILDQDTESYWAYNRADSLLNTINLDGTEYYRDLSKVYSAYSLIFYGMSYTRSVYAMSAVFRGERKDNYSLQELSNTIIHYERGNEITYYQLSKNEIASIYSMINFYKASQMTAYDDMNNRYNYYFDNMEESYSVYSRNKERYKEIDIYRTIAIHNKKLFFKTFSRFVLDIFLTRNQNISALEYEKFVNILNSKGQVLDNISDTYIEISNMTDLSYFKNEKICSDVYLFLFELLSKEITSLK